MRCNSLRKSGRVWNGGWVRVGLGTASRGPGSACSRPGRREGVADLSFGGTVSRSRIDFQPSGTTGGGGGFGHGGAVSRSRIGFLPSGTTE